eukprot:9188011-Pyramimonas_sp.AAC.1
MDGDGSGNIIPAAVEVQAVGLSLEGPPAGLTQYPELGGTHVLAVSRQCGDKYIVWCGNKVNRQYNAAFGFRRDCIGRETDVKVKPSYTNNIYGIVEGSVVAHVFQDKSSLDTHHPTPCHRKKWLRKDRHRVNLMEMISVQLCKFELVYCSSPHS